MTENAKTKGDEYAKNNLWERCELKEEERKKQFVEGGKKKYERSKKINTYVKQKTEERRKWKTTCVN